MQCRAILPALQTAGLPQHAPTHMKPQSAVLPCEAAKARRAQLIGIALMCGAVGTFSCLDTTAKYLGRHVDVMQVVWARYTERDLVF
jgi:hypothetical protein